MKKQQSKIMYFSPCEQEQIDALISKYSFQHVTFFREEIYRLYEFNNLEYQLSRMDNDQVSLSCYFVWVMLNLIEDPYKPYFIDRDQVDKFLPNAKISIDAGNLNEHKFFDHMHWLLEVLQETQVTTLSILDSYYSKFPYKSKETKKRKTKPKRWLI